MPKLKLIHGNAVFNSLNRLQPLLILFLNAENKKIECTPSPPKENTFNLKVVLALKQQPQPQAKILPGLDDFVSKLTHSNKHLK